MSIDAVSWALRVPVGGNPKIMLLGLADHAHPDGTESYPALDTLAVYGHCDRSTARRNVRKLVADGWIEETGVGPKGQTKYRLCLERQNATPPRSGDGTGASQGVAPMPPEPSLEPSLLGESAPARDLPKISGKPVNAESWKLTEAILDAFNQLAGKKLRLLTSAGQPSEAAKRIYGRVRAYPDITATEHGDIIRRTLKSKWWGNGPSSIGVVYGPRVFEDNITRGLDSRAARDPNRFKRTRSVEEDDFGRGKD